MTRHAKARRMLRLQALRTVASYWERGVRCFGRPTPWCGRADRDLLDLDHRESLAGRPNRYNSHYGAANRAKEAIAHPERFQLLCVSHHRKKSLRRKEYHRHTLRMRNGSTVSFVKMGGGRLKGCSSFPTFP